MISIWYHNHHNVNLHYKTIFICITANKYCYPWFLLNNLVFLELPQQVRSSDHDQGSPTVVTLWLVQQYLHSQMVLHSPNQQRQSIRAVDNTIPLNLKQNTITFCYVHNSDLSIIFCACNEFNYPATIRNHIARCNWCSNSANITEAVRMLLAINKQLLNAVQWSLDLVKTSWVICNEEWSEDICELFGRHCTMACQQCEMCIESVPDCCTAPIYLFSVNQHAVSVCNSNNTNYHHQQHYYQCHYHYHHQ